MLKDHNIKNIHIKVIFLGASQLWLIVGPDGHLIEPPQSSTLSHVKVTP